MCVNCASQYVNVNGICVPKGPCKVNGQNGQCQDCYSNARLFNGFCILYVPLCHNYAQNGNCAVCTQNAIYKNGKCIPATCKLALNHCT